ncbi:hypothetical protein HAX54_049221, partial [Datura stramonium]|nr:hypothetical protein [Datura stramonium]
QNPISNLYYSATSPTVELSVDPAKKKRGRSKKTPVAQIPSVVNCVDPGVGGINGVASSKNRSKKGR